MRSTSQHLPSVLSFSADPFTPAPAPAPGEREMLKVEKVRL